MAFALRIARASASDRADLERLGRREGSGSSFHRYSLSCFFLLYSASNFLSWAGSGACQFAQFLRGSVFTRLAGPPGVASRRRAIVSEFYNQTTLIHFEQAAQFENIETVINRKTV